ncbi:S9 family peptidase [Erythrobacter dokdonensis]|jgi:dipeptidyl aminopeptidase/acylaminoacyl peptidase|uniref:Prolyl oligopeptidase family protein n=1 Tax=Erythrobacter dokdonensis DSW-74 TaxID=1300349 RepID=A0A1A7BHQ6_9SPHN|nr:prolyl oligopeptidase family serine peptidase [Erythrobacter dokdonensis]MEE4316164.1 prolyl oligopeptidase family serine peptidase [Erythrobacter sp.]OBV11251.1 Prolyl oligopeptidase family protein [Erythrobacter dokdonensis DSW-74]
MRHIRLIAALLAPLPLGAALPAAAQDAPASAETPAIPVPAALTAEDMPPVPLTLAERARPYLEARGASFAGWDPNARAVLISTRFANVSQLHRVEAPMGARTQISFEAEPVRGSYAPKRGDIILVTKDRGGDEYYQFHTLKEGRLTLLTDGKSRNQLNSWSEDGELIGFSSTRRNGVDSDLYVMNPRDPASARLVHESKGGGWALTGFSPDKKTAYVADYQSVQNLDLYTLDLASGAMTPIGDPAEEIAYGGLAVAPDGSLWVTSDYGADFQQLGRLDPASGVFTPVSRETWDVDSFDLSEDGKTIAYVVNEAGTDRLRLLDVATGKVTRVDALPAGQISGVSFAPWGEIGFAFSSAKSAADVWSLDPKTMKLTRWTQSETGGLDPKTNVEPRIVTTKSFDGLEVSGLLYQPDPAKFKGPRPLIVSVHGGPEGQSTAGFMGRNNYYLNELGIGIFYPNVRGSTGYGKTFVSLDNGPFKREDSVKDMAALIDAVRADPAVDAGKVGLTGGSYGGYMCYAAAVQLKDKLAATQCTVAISNFVSFLENTNPYRQDLRRAEYGDERIPEQRAKLAEISPLTRVNEIEKPMFVITGANDPRVPKSEADQMVAAIRANGGEAWHLVAADEGHGFRKKANSDYAFLAQLMFWQEHLLGK